jgi:hypothetical protein
VTYILHSSGLRSTVSNLLCLCLAKPILWNWAVSISNKSFLAFLLNLKKPGMTSILSKLIRIVIRLVDE